MRIISVGDDKKQKTKIKTNSGNIITGPAKLSKIKIKCTKTQKKKFNHPSVQTFNRCDLCNLLNCFLLNSILFMIFTLFLWMIETNDHCRLCMYNVVCI